MNIENLTLENDGPQTGLSLYEGAEYIATYRSAHECIHDLTYRFKIQNLESLLAKFNVQSNNKYIITPFIYRGVCSEYFFPTEKVYRYVYYSDKLSEIFEHFSFHENRANKFPDYFEYGVQGNGIHLFDKEQLSYQYWIGGPNIKSIQDVMKQVKKKNLQIPSALKKEYDLLDHYDVFISHKSDDYEIAKRVYDILSDKGYKVFLSEISLPAISNADYTAEISNALDKSDNLIVIVDNVTKISSGWVKYEWTAFINEKLSGRKKGNILSVISPHIPINDLPFMLRQYEVLNIGNISNIEQWMSVL